MQSDYSEKRVREKVEVHLNSGSSEWERYTEEIKYEGNQELRFYDNERYGEKKKKNSENTQKRIKEKVKRKI